MFCGPGVFMGGNFIVCKNIGDGKNFVIMFLCNLIYFMECLGCIAIDI